MASSRDVSPKLDLDSYIANYSGPLRLNRLVAIAKSDSHLAPDALRLAIRQAKTSLNTDEYLELTKTLKAIAPNDPLADVDLDWIPSTQRKAKLETDRLESELKQYKNNLIKESIRVRENQSITDHSVC